MSLHRYEAQRLKPINEPMMEQITYYCVMNYPEEHAAQNCPGFKADIQLNQGTASDWLANERKAFVSKLRVKEAEYDALMK